MKKSILFTIAAVLAFFSFSFAGNVAMWDAQGWNYTQGYTTSGNYIRLSNSNTNIWAYENDYSPSQWALFAATIRDFFINDNNSALHVQYLTDGYGTGNHKLEILTLAGK